MRSSENESRFSRSERVPETSSTYEKILSRVVCTSGLRLLKASPMLTADFWTIGFSDSYNGVTFGFPVVGRVMLLDFVAAGVFFLSGSFAGNLSIFSLSVTNSSVSILVWLTPAIISVGVLVSPALHIITCESLPPVQKKSPPGEKVPLQEGPVWPRSVYRIWPFLRSQILTLPSFEVESKKVPWGWKDTEFIKSSCAS